MDRDVEPSRDDPGDQVRGGVLGQLHPHLGMAGMDGGDHTGQETRAHAGVAADHHPPAQRDRKSTRLNSSHVAISYAVFCLKKKIARTIRMRPPRSTTPPPALTIRR